MASYRGPIIPNLDSFLFQIQSMNDAYFLDLEFNLGTYVPDLLICHSVNELQIAGLGKWLNDKSKSKDIKVYIGLMDMGTSQDEKRNTDIYEFVENSFKTIKNIPSCTVHLGTQNEFFQTEFEKKRFGRKNYIISSGGGFNSLRLKKIL